MSGVGEVLDRKYRLEDRLQALGWTPALWRVHQQKLIVRGLLDFDQVRHLADFLDVPEHLANALAARECLRHVAPLKLACPPLLTPRAGARFGNSAGPGGVVADAPLTQRGVVADAPLTQNCTGSLRGSCSESPTGRLTTLTPANVFETPETAPGQWPGPSRFDQPSPAMRGASLLDLDLSPSLFQSRLDLLRLFLADAFFDRLRRSFDQVLGFLQAERGDGAHFLDHFDLFVADRREDDRKLGLLLDRRGGCASGRSSGDRHRSGGQDAPLAFKQFGELRGLQDRKAREFVDDFFEIGH